MWSLPDERARLDTGQAGQAAAVVYGRVLRRECDDPLCKGPGSEVGMEASRFAVGP